MFVTYFDLLIHILLKTCGQLIRVNGTKNIFLHRNSILTPCFFLYQFWHCVFQFVTILITWPVNQVTCWRGMMTCQFWWRGMLTWYADVSKLIFFSTKNTKFSLFFDFDTKFNFLFQFWHYVFFVPIEHHLSNFVQFCLFSIWNRINIFFLLHFKPYKHIFFV